MKFQDVKLENKQLSFVHAGDTCTGGGVGQYVTGSGDKVVYSYESDSTNDNGMTTYYKYEMTLYAKK